MKNLIILMLAASSFFAHAGGWKVDFGVVSIGGGGNPVFGPGSLQTTPGGGGSSGSTGIVPSEPGQPGANEPNIPLPQILKSVAVVNQSDDLVRIVDALGDIITFGKIGRNRDKDRANAAEAQAKATRDGQDKAINEKRNGLLRALEVANQNYNDWADFRAQAPAVLASQERILLLAQKELTSRLQLQANIRAARNSVQDGSVALRLLSSLFSKQASVQDADQMINKSLNEWVKSGKTLEDIAKNANMEASKLIAAAITSADEASLQQFIQQVSEMRLQVEALLYVSAEKLNAALIRKEGLEKELSVIR